MSAAPTPPALAAALLRRLLPEDALGDLEEAFARRAERDGPRAARAWYRREALRFLLLWPALRPRDGPLAGASSGRGPAGRRLDALAQDLRFAARSLTRRPGFTAVVVLTLALGIGANATIFSLVNGVFLRPVPGVRDPGGIVEIFGSSSRDANAGGFRGYLPMSWPTLRDVRERASTLEDVYVYTIFPASLVAGNEPERVMAGYVSGSFFDLLGVRPALGRTFAPEEGEAGGGAPVAVLSHGFWERRFGGEPDVVGRTVTLNTRPYTVIGVAPERFRGTSTLFGPDLWAPLPMIADIPVWGPLWENRSVRMFFAGARLEAGRSLAEARAELEAIGARIAETYPDEVRERSIEAVPLSEAAVSPNMRGALLGAGTVLLAMVTLLLAIACINVANLLLGQALGRRREMAIRRSVGAGRGRLAAQLATESVVLFGLGGALGVALSLQAQRILAGLRMPIFFGFEVSLDVRPDARVLAFAAAVTLTCALLFGMLPAWRAARGDVSSELREGDVRAGRSASGWLRGGLVVAQVALSLVALVGAGLFARSLQAARSADPGFEPAGLAMVSVDLGAQRYGAEEGRLYYRRAVDRLESVPGVASAAVGELRPLTAGPLRRVLHEDEPRDDPSLGHMVRTGSVSPGYFATMDIPLVQGRGFLPSDDEEAPDVAVVNRRLVELFWPDGDPLGRRLQIGLEAEAVEVVGVVPTGKYGDLAEDPQPALYRPVAQLYPPTATLFVRGRDGAPPPLPAARRAVQDLDAALPLFDVEPAEALLGRALWEDRAVALLLGVFGLVGMLLAAVGIYGVVAASVRERTREMGLRIALGARSGSVLALVLGRVLALSLAGSILGLAAAALLTRPLGSLLYGVGVADPLTFGGVAALLLAVALAAGYLPARRATRVDPMVALRSD